MRVALEIPEPKLDKALAKQFAEIQQSLMGLVNTQQQQSAFQLQAMQTQQETLVAAMTQLMSMVGGRKGSENGEALASALRGLKKVMAGLPGDLKDALDKQYEQAQKRTVKVTVNPDVKVEMPKGMMKKLDALEQAFSAGSKRSRNRTFGSNY